jgi:formyltetrahydrofolate deformylase
MNKIIILIQCSDEVGLVTRITRILAEHRLNIVTMREFVDEAASLFFTRVECVDNGSNAELLQKELQSHLPADTWINIVPKKEKRVAVLVTREYHCLGDILVRQYFQTLGARVCCVVGNHDDLRGFTEQFSLPFYRITHEGKTKESFETEILEILDQYEPDYLVLAKFMRILSPQFTDRFPNRILNIHHSFLPAFAGARPYRRAFERGVKLIGATAHFVTNDLDEGPIIAQQIIPVNHNFGVNDMVIAGKEIEKSVLNTAMHLVFEDRVFVTGNKTIVFE